MLGLENPLHILFLLAVLLMLFGAKRLPELGRGLGEGMRGFKDAVSGAAARSHLTAGSAEPAEPAAGERVDALAAPAGAPTPSR
jgi:sec-independent protein translocase protein TatA